MVSTKKPAKVRKAKSVIPLEDAEELFDERLLEPLKDGLEGLEDDIDDDPIEDDPIEDVGDSESEDEAILEFPPSGREPSTASNSDAQLQQLMQIVENLAKGQAQLQQQLLELSASNPDKLPLSQRLSNTTPSVPEAPTPEAPTTKNESKHLKIDLPSAFDGKNRKETRPFLMKCQDVFNIHHNMYDTDQKKIVAFASRLSGGCASWHYMARATNQPWVTTWEAFKDKFIEAWKDPDEYGTAKADLAKCRQTSSAAEYAAKFNLLTSILKYNDSAKCVAFVDGLKEDVQDELTHYEPIIDDYPALEERVIQLDNRLYARRRTKKQASNNPRNTPSNGKDRSSRKSDDKGKSSQPNKKAKTDTPAKKYIPFRDLSQQEKDSREAKGNCIYHDNPKNSCTKCKAYKERQAKKNNDNGKDKGKGKDRGTGK